MDWDPVTHYQEVAVAERYDKERFSSISGRVFNALEQRAIKAAFRDVPQTGTVLDLPCGTGRLAVSLLESGFSVEGVDISASMLDVARRKLSSFGSRFTTRVVDVHEMAKTDPKRYDACLCARVLMHFPLDEQIAFLRSVAKVTKGPVILTQSYSSPYQRFRRRLKTYLGNQAPANYPLTEADLAALLRGAGLREVRRLRLASMVSEAMIVVTEHL